MQDTQTASSTDDPDAGRGPRLDRRSLIKGAGMAGAAAIAGPSAVNHAVQPTAAASSGIDYAFRSDASGRAASLMMMAAPVTPIGASIKVAEAGGEAADWLFGSFSEDGSGDQLVLDMYSQGQTIRENFQMLLKQNINNLELAENNAIASSKYEVAKVIRDGGTKSEAGFAARDAVFEQYATYQKNFIKALEAALARLQHIRDLEVNDPDVDNPTIWYNVDWDGYDESWKPKNGSNEDLIELPDIEIELLNGETCQTKALMAGAGYNSNVEQWIIHPYLDSQTDKSGNSLRSYVLTDVASADYEGSQHRLGGDPHYENYDDSRYNLYIERYDSNNPEFNPIHVKFLDGYNVHNSVSDYITEYIHNRAIALANEAQTLGEDLYEQYQSGEITMNDIIDPYVRAEEYALDWRDTGHFGYAAGFANQYGYASDLSKTMKVEWYDKSENQTQTLSGTLLPSPRVSKKQVSKTAEITSWTYGSNLDVTSKVGEDVVARRTGHTVVWIDSSGTSHTLSEGSDYVNKLGKGVIEIPSDSSTVSSESGTIKVTVDAEILQQKTFKVGQTYTVKQNGDYLFAVQGGLKTFDKGDEFTVKKLFNASGEEINEVSTDPGNQQTLNTQQILERLRRMEKALERLNRTNPPSGGGDDSGGIDVGSVDEWLQTVEDNAPAIAIIGGAVVAGIAVLTNVIDSLTPF